MSEAVIDLTASSPDPPSPVQIRPRRRLYDEDRNLPSIPVPSTSPDLDDFGIPYSDYNLRDSDFDEFLANYDDTPSARSSVPAATATARPVSRNRTQMTPSASNTTALLPDVTNLISNSAIKRSNSTSVTPAPPSKRFKTDEVKDVIDMVDVEDNDGVQKLIQQQMLKAQAEEGEKRKMSDFKCVICLDDPVLLSSTPCGHLFCNECLNTTLRYGQPNAKFGKCPVCRTRVNIKDIVPLELKLATKLKGKGKGKLVG